VLFGYQSMLTVTDVAKSWGVSPALIYALVAEGKLRCFRLGLGRGTIRFSEEQIAEYLQQSEIHPETLKHIR
jgi:excisionase family DNA binding protein